MRDQIISKIEMTVYFRILSLKHMSVVCSRSLVALAKESPSGDTKLSLGLVAQFHHCMVEVVDPLDVMHLHQDINGRFGADIRNSRAPDVMDRHNFQAQNSGDVSGFCLEQFGRVRIMWNNLNFSRHSRVPSVALAIRVSFHHQKFLKGDPVVTSFLAT